MPTLPVAYTAVLSELMYAHSGEMAGIYDLDLRWFTHVNPAGVELLAYPSEEALLADANHSLRIPPWTPEQWQRLCDITRREGHHELEADIRRHVGEPFRAYVKLTYFEIDGRALFLVNITEHSRLQQAERALAHSVRRFEAVFTNATLGIIVCDQPGRILSVNAHAGQLFGYAPPELLGQQIEVLVPDAAGRHHAQLRQSYNGDPQVRPMGHNRPLAGQRRDGSVFPVEASLSYFYLDEELYVVAYLVDLTAKQAAEQELLAQHQRVARLNAELEQKVVDRTNALMLTLHQLENRSEELAQALQAEQMLGELKSRFVSMASHEFRTPLTAVLSSADLIEEFPGGHQQAQRLKYINHIRTSVQHLNTILEEFLSVGRIEDGKIEAHPSNLNLTSLVHDTVADMQSLLKSGQVIDWQVDCPIPVRLDASLLRKILMNLLSNSLKYSGENSVITVRASCLLQELTITVKDRGLGISTEDQAHLFEQFYRAPTVVSVPGTGLGLYIIAKYLELMGGTIDLQSVLNEGTSVTIKLPLATPDQGDAAP
ncbi:sensor histidine kinase [Hymenobacter glacialis]|uniref:histidine kinase n=1 Tax=Hymenobacter glacialis TaxID=1908236 RepID=A0A1G1TDB6_9BACT|nr:PAS domain-containing sensor histidine kinase [Hymenobacter glacialis]OGX88868.1 PAS domain-containing sensor histidine kinase [Hymenobacter glacialis]